MGVGTQRHRARVNRARDLGTMLDGWRERVCVGPQMPIPAPDELPTEAQPAEAASTEPSANVIPPLAREAEVIRAADPAPPPRRDLSARRTRPV